MKTNKKLTMAAATVLFAVWAFPMVASATRTSTAMHYVAVNPSCWTSAGTMGGQQQANCSTNEAIYFAAQTDSKGYSPDVYFHVWNTSASIQVSCQSVGAYLDGGATVGTSRSAGTAGYSTIHLSSSTSDAWMPNGALYFKCIVPQTNKILNFEYDY